MTPSRGKPVFATILCLRHGPLAPEFRGAAVGKTDAPRDPAAAESEARAVETVARFRPVRVLSSDRLRASGPASTLAERLGIPHSVRRELRDQDFGVWEGKPWPAIVAGDPKKASAFLNDFSNAVPPRGSSLRSASTRVVRTVLAEARRHHRQTVAWIADAGPIRCLIARALGLDLAAVQRMKLDPFSLTIVRLQADASSLALLNYPAAGGAAESAVW